jgi:hypothetical protein
MTSEHPGIHLRKSAQLVGEMTLTGYPCFLKKWYKPKAEPIASGSGFWCIVITMGSEGDKNSKTVLISFISDYKCTILMLKINKPFLGAWLSMVYLCIPQNKRI